MRGIRKRSAPGRLSFRARGRTRLGVVARVGMGLATIALPVSFSMVLDTTSAGADTPPTISAVSPDVGPVSGGTSVTIDGSGFVDGSTAVEFGTTTATGVTVVSPNELTVISPPGSAGSVDVSITTPSPGGTSMASAADLFAYGSPTITGITPNAGPVAGGTAVVVTGTGFAPGATIDFGTLAAVNVTVTSATTLLATTPQSSGSGSSDVTATMPEPAGTSSTSVNDLFAFGPATGSLIAPDTGPANTATAVTISGSGFSLGDTVNFGLLDATDVTVVSPTQITATSPATLSGGASVTITNATGSSTPSVSMQYAAGAPSVSDVTPAAGPTSGGGVVTVLGDGFVAGTTVEFGGVDSPGVAVISPTSVLASVPAGSGGSVDVTVMTPAGTSETSPDDLYAYGTPTVSAISPDSGPVTAGTVVTITGSDFVQSAQVSFGGALATVVAVNATGTSMQVSAPANAGGAVDVTVATPAGTSVVSLADLYAYGPPTVTGVTPDAGAVAGGNTVTVTGNALALGVTVYFGAVASPSVTVLPGGKSLEAVAPANSAGPVDITLTSPQGTSAATPHDSYFYGSPVVTSVSPATGSTVGGTAVTITGSGFAPDATVTFGLITATSVTHTSPTSITAITPSGNPGVVPVRVSTPAGISPVVDADQFEYSDQLQISCGPPFSPTTACDSINLPAVNIESQWQTTSAPSNTLYVTDDRGDASVGWSLSAYLVPTSNNPNGSCAGWAGFCDATSGPAASSPDAKIASDFLSLSNVSCVPSAGNNSASPLAGAGGTFPVGEGAVALCTAQAGSSAGTFVVNGEFSLQVPPWIAAGQYDATVEFLVM